LASVGQDQADGRFFTRQPFMLVQPLQLQLQLALVRGLEAAEFEFDGREATQPSGWRTCSRFDGSSYASPQSAGNSLTEITVRAQQTFAWAGRKCDFEPVQNGRRGPDSLITRAGPTPIHGWKR